LFRTPSLRGGRGGAFGRIRKRNKKGTKEGKLQNRGGKVDRKRKGKYRGKDPRASGKLWRGKASVKEYPLRSKPEQKTSKKRAIEKKIIKTTFGTGTWEKTARIHKKKKVVQGGEGGDFGGSTFGNHCGGKLKN